MALKLLHSTARKMRRNDLWAGGISLQVGFYDRAAFACNIRIEPCDDPFKLQEDLISIWARVRAYTPSNISVALTQLDLAPSPDLFGIDPFNERTSIERVVAAPDILNARYGLNTVYLGSIHQVLKEAPTRIPFGAPPPLEESGDTDDKLRADGSTRHSQIRSSQCAIENVFIYLSPVLRMADFAPGAGRDTGAKTLYIEPLSPWENGYFEAVLEALV